MSWQNDFTRINSSSEGAVASTALFWFRRDLRVKDNAGLYHALKEHSNVVPLFIFDTQILNRLHDKQDARVEFILESLTVLDAALREHGSSLLVLHGDPVELFSRMNVLVVYANRDYEPYALARDNSVQNILAARGGELRTFKDQVIFDHNEITKADGKPYSIFTPYSRAWTAKVNAFYTKSFQTEKYAYNLQQSGASRESGTSHVSGALLPLISPALPTLEQIGFANTAQTFPPRIVRRSVVAQYDQTRNFPAIRGTTRLSVHLRFGTVSIRNLVRLAMKENKTWLSELIWREFYQMILFHFPKVVTSSFKPAYDRIAWRNNEAEFLAWCDGRTGYPLVDAGMRELNETGFMHNRVRMVTASFLTKHLLIDWRWGEAYFASKLLDYDLAANNGGWQWAAGTGCDAAPYFRVFNPELQRQKFDPDFEYIMQWVPEFQSADYPRPIVEHKFARERALGAYQVVRSVD